MSDDPKFTELDLLQAILTVLLDERTRSIDRADEPNEVVLARAGLSHVTIAGLVGKKPDAVRMLLARRASKGA